MAALTEEQSLLQEQARTWARDEAPVARFREMRDSGNEQGFDKSSWASIGEMGWAGIVVPETYGGVDMGFLWAPPRSCSAAARSRSAPGCRASLREVPS